MSDIKEDLASSPGDYLHSAVRGALAAIPFVGGAATELFSILIAPPLTQRRDQWLITLAEGLEELRNAVPDFDINSLVGNEVFVTAVLQASQVALRNHQEEKLVALRNAVLNSAVGVNTDENIQLMFLNLIDTMTPWHLRILNLFKNPRQWFQDNQMPMPELYMGSPADILELAISELKEKRSFYDLIVKDLYAKGLLNTESLHVAMTGDGTLAKRTTDFGDLFVAYITSPY